MIAASVYIIACSTRNRLRVRLRRLREPRYLVGAIVGAAYIYFSIFARFRARGSVRRRGRPAQAAPEQLAALAAAGPAFGGLILMVSAAIGWLIPFDSGLLAFSQPEVQFLFTAPVSRRALLLHRMLRSQIGMLFGALIVAVTAPAADGYSRVRTAIGMWLLMCTWKIYYTGISLARSRLRTAHDGARRVAVLPLAVITVAFMVVGAAVWRSFATAPIAGVRDVADRIVGITGSGAAGVVLWPFVALARPLFAQWPTAYIVSLAASASVLAAAVLWVLMSDSAFQDAAEAISERRENERHRADARYRVRTTAWRLAPVGRLEPVFVWKAALQTIRSVDRGSATRIAVAVVAFLVATLGLGRRGGGDAFAVIAMAAAAFSILLAPQLLRIDLRQDLANLELLKSWPAGGPSVVRGEMLWPGMLLTAASWILIGIALLYSFTPFGRMSAATRFSGGGAAIVAAPALIFAQLAIQNAMALIFPAWVPLGRQRARGLDMMGQRIIVLSATWLVLIVMLIPAVIPAAMVWFVLRYAIGVAAWIPAALAVTAVMLVEVFVATELLGSVYDGLDMSAIEAPEN